MELEADEDDENDTKDEDNMSDVLTSDDDEDRDEKNEKKHKKEASDDAYVYNSKKQKKQKKNNDLIQQQPNQQVSAPTPQATASATAEATANGETTTAANSNTNKQPLERTELAKQAPADLVALFRTNMREAYTDDDQDLQAIGDTLFQQWYDRAPTWKNPKKKDSQLPKLSSEESQAWVKYLYCLLHKHKAPVPYLHRQFTSVVEGFHKAKKMTLKAILADRERQSSNPSVSPVLIQRNYKQATINESLQQQGDTKAKRNPFGFQFNKEVYNEEQASQLETLCTKTFALQAVVNKNANQRRWRLLPSSDCYKET